MDIKLTTPLTKEKVQGLKSGDKVLITGTIYTLRDAGHKKMIEQINNGDTLPINIKDNIIYYAGPSPAKPGQVIGSAGPTTSYRMDDYTPTLLDLGLKGMIGKGDRNEAVIQSMKKNTCVYFAAVGGAAALIANTIKNCEVIAYEELGTESLKKLEVEDFPVIVVIDCNGNNLYKSERAKYRA
ncbi:MAG: fumarate hydratase [Firmicutes bacterium HGW-Firmicutes-1]|jgi:fumarate hydratase subunit beta|nr:MAG: fumarate hydratase [Firmicutes bacterium HGW-Firmicutes-1]